MRAFDDIIIHCTATRKSQHHTVEDLAHEHPLFVLIQTPQGIFPQAGLHRHNEYSEKACPCFNVAVWRAKHGY